MGYFENVEQLKRNIANLFETDAFRNVNSSENREFFLKTILDNSDAGELRIEWAATPQDVDTWLEESLSLENREDMIPFSIWCIDKIYEQYPDYDIDDRNYFLRHLRDDIRLCGNEDLKKALRSIDDNDLLEALSDHDIITTSIDLTEPAVKANFLFATREEVNQCADSIPFIASCIRDDYSAKRFLNEPDFAAAMYDNAMTYFLKSQDSSMAEALGFGENDEDGTLSYPAPDNLGQDEQFKYNARFEMEEQSLSDYPGMLTALTKITPEELYNILKSPSVKLEGHMTMGLYDKYNGAGASLGMTLRKDAILPVNLIHSIEIEEGNSRNTLDSVFGLVFRCWDGKITASQEKVDLKIEEDFEQFRDLVRQRLEERAEVLEDEAELVRP